MSDITSTGIDRSRMEEWFHINEGKDGGIGFITPKKAFFDYLAEARLVREPVSYLTSVKPVTRGIDDLTEAELKDWASRFDPEDMTLQDYRAFIDELISADVLDRRDTNYINYSNLVSIGTPDTWHLSSGAYFVPIEGERFTTLADAEGNALAWAQHRAKWVAAEYTSGHQKNLAVEYGSELFAKLAEILEAMYSIRGKQETA